MADNTEQPGSGLVSLAEIQEAAGLLAAVTVRTPLVPVPRLHPDLLIKPESLQPTGSFKLRGAYTDPQRLRKTDPGRPEICNIFTMHKAVSPAETVATVHASCMGATWGCVDCKKVMFENFERELVPLRTKRAELQANPALVDAALFSPNHRGLAQQRRSRSLSIAQPCT